MSQSWGTSRERGKGEKCVDLWFVPAIAAMLYDYMTRRVSGNEDGGGRFDEGQ